MKQYAGPQLFDSLKRALGREVIGLGYFYLLAALLRPLFVVEFQQHALMRMDWMELLARLSLLLFLNVYLVARGLALLMPAGYGAASGLAALVIGILFGSPELAAALLAIVLVVPRIWTRYTETAGGRWWEKKGLTVTLYGVGLLAGLLLLAVALL